MPRDQLRRPLRGGTRRWRAVFAWSATLVGGAACGGGGEDGKVDPIIPPPAEMQVAPAPGGLRRLTGTQIINSVSDLLGPSAASQLSLPDTPQLHGFESIAAAELTTTSNEVANFEFTFTSALDAALADLSTVSGIAPCVATPSDACYAEVAEQFGRRAWRRPLDADEIGRLTNLGNAGRAWASGDFDQGLKYELLGILQSPNFLYMVEIGELDPKTGQRNLTGWELATRMSFFLVHRTPDAALLDAAEKGDLATDDGIRAAANRLLDEPEAQAALDRYFGELFYLRDLPDVQKDPTTFPEYDDALAASMEEGTLRFLRDLVWTRNADARELFTSPDVFIDAKSAPIYGQASPATGWAKVTLPPDQKRAGLLGQIGYLARFAHPSLTSPTRRGRFVQERLLCNEIPPPPPGQNTSIPEEPPGQPMTMKQKLVQHETDPKCASCHLDMDPIGFALENYDGIGRFRADDRGLPLDTTGTVGNIGSFASAQDLGALLHDNPAATTCMIKNFIRGSMGHLESKGESEAVTALDKSFATSGYSMKSLMAELCTSPIFRRVGDPK